jgi:hypothetical protein
MLFSITWEMYSTTKAIGCKAFANMTEEDDEKDSGPEVRIVGRWSHIGGGAGVCICETDSAEALFAWMAHWADVCDIKVTPVLEDAPCRKILQSIYNIEKTPQSN